MPGRVGKDGNPALHRCHDCVIMKKTLDDAPIGNSFRPHGIWREMLIACGDGQVAAVLLDTPICVGQGIGLRLDDRLSGLAPGRLHGGIDRVGNITRVNAESLEGR